MIHLAATMISRLITIFVVLCLASCICRGAATITCGPGDNASAKLAQCHVGDTFKLLDGAAVSGLQSAGVYWVLADGATASVDQCKIAGTGLPNGSLIYVGGGHFTVTRCAFSGADSMNGIYGFPANNCKFSNNSFDHVWEPVHLISTADGIDVSGNVITHATRIGIELQSGMTHLTVNNNWMSDWLPFLDSHNLDSKMSISCATGGSGTPPYPGQGRHITISGNTLLQNGPAQNNNTQAAKAAIEIMGDLDINITGNYCWNWGCGVLNGCEGSEGANSSNNTYICYSRVAGDGVGWPNPPVHGTGDKVFAPGDVTAPAWPAAPAAVAPPLPLVYPGPPAAPTGSGPQPPTVAAPASCTIALNGQPGQVVVTFPVPPAGQTANVSLIPDGDASLAKKFVGVTSPVVIGNVPDSWHVHSSAAYVSAGVESAQTASATVQVTNPNLPASSPFNPQLVTTPTPPTVTVTHINQLTVDGAVVWKQTVYSDGSVK